MNKSFRCFNLTFFLQLVDVEHIDNKVDIDIPKQRKTLKFNLFKKHRNKNNNKNPKFTKCSNAYYKQVGFIRLITYSQLF